ncbi:ATP-binding protein [Cumulibacter manganitolerans]|uniref:ATP-binding protein n=1 Tax=Cumulibacter manganitolerans TaxID=1884992 RepID=UPI001E434CDD|nr:biotin carboxylase N-terminal domain-containing protein [Cumulibacter manganitolerans]
MESEQQMFSKVLIANRGEIACRIIRTLHDMGIQSVAVYSDADAGAKHVREAGEAVHLGPTNARESYLDIAKVIAAAQSTGAQAIHPGYGFLAENAEFAKACRDAGITFIGPSPEAIETMGDKISAKLTVSKAGVPVVPGRSEPGMTDDDLYDAALEVGFPVLIKPSAGGGGKGMYLVEREDDLRSSIASARREAASSFGDDTLFLERFVKDPRHIEVQVLADSHGHTIHLGERECSLQRRHQKIIEEAPSALLDAATRERIGKAAVDTAAAVAYSGAGTVEFIVSADRPDEFFFMEMNTRLQVEHPVTELVTGFDLVEQQVLVAAGHELQIQQDDVELRGHAIEARVYAENPDRDFLPTGGTVTYLDESDDSTIARFHADDAAGQAGFFSFDPVAAADEGSTWPEDPTFDGVRVDSALIEDLQVATTYDPMIAKVIVHGHDRADALDRLDRALARYTVFGVVTNVNFLRALIAHPKVRSGDLDTGLVGRDLDSLVGRPVPREIYLAAAADLFAREAAGRPYADDPWESITGWRPGRAPVPMHWAARGPGGDKVALYALPTRVTDDEAELDITVGDETVHVLAAQYPETIEIDGLRRDYVAEVGDSEAWMWVEGVGTYVVPRLSPEQELGGHGGAAGGEVRSPMPGTVIAVHTENDAEVAAGEPLIVVEAMKMEHVLKAPVAGTVRGLTAGTGTQVVVDQLLMTVEPTTEK